MLDPKVSALLRLKRHEQPPPGYFEQLLADVHRRQRAELLKQPLWRIAVERVQVFFSEHSMGNLSYASAMATVLVVGVSAIAFMTNGEPRSTSRAIAEAQPVPPVPASVPTQTVAATAPTEGSNRTLVFGLQSSQQLAPLLETRRAASTQIGAPRYIIDARPVSYERASSF